MQNKTKNLSQRETSLFSQHHPYLNGRGNIGADDLHPIKMEATFLIEANRTSIIFQNPQTLNRIILDMLQTCLHQFATNAFAIILG